MKSHHLSECPERGARASRCSIALVLLVGLGAAACDKGGAGAESPGGGEKNPLIGSPAPDFDLPAQSGGKRASLSSVKGKIVLVDFWATWCAPCKASFPKYEALAKAHGDSVAVIGISEDDEADGIADFAKQTGVTFTLAWDQDKSVASTYHPGSMPTSFVVDGNGLVRFVHAGFRDGEESTIDKEIKSLLE